MQIIVMGSLWAMPCADAQLPFQDNTFDVITNAVSVDYLTRPLEVFREMHRVLKPGGQAIMSFSNRCFPTKGARPTSNSKWKMIKPPDQTPFAAFSGGTETSMSI
jgi:ubiquinone/menaquinone biosynthesis C-methylase UbiE